MPRRANRFAGYQDPGLGEAFSNLARAMFGSAQDDAYAANANAARQLAAQREQALNEARALDGAVTATAALPQFQSRIVEALGYGPSTVNEAGMLIRPVSPDGPQMSVPVLPDQASVTPQQLSALARTFIGTGGNTQQMTAGLNNIGQAVSNRNAERILLNPSAPGVSEDQVRGAATFLKGPGGVDADFAPTVGAQNRVQGFITQRNKDTIAGRLAGDKYSADRRFDASRYDTDNKPVVVGQNGTAFLPQGAQRRFGGQTELQGQQSIVNVPQGSTGYVPESRQGDFGGATTLDGKDKPVAAGRGGSGSNNGKPVNIPKAAQDRMDAGMDRQLKNAGVKLDPESGQALRSELGAIWQNSRNPDQAADVVFQALKAGNTVNGVRLVEDKGVFSTSLVPQRDPAGKPAVPKKGDIRQGYRFKGGNPGDQAAWEKL